MKHLLFTKQVYLIAWSIVFCSFTAIAQRPFEGANTIYITTSLADKQTYMAIQNVLQEQSLTFSAGRDCLFFTAQERSLTSKDKAVFAGQIWVNGGLVKLVGKMQTQMPAVEGSTNPAVIPAAYQPTKRSESVQQLGFLYLNDLAMKLKPALRGVVAYKVQ